jgi:hypothetical protein
MAVIKITAAKNSGNAVTFSLVDSDGVPVNLDALGATLVTVTVCGGRYACGEATIDSGTPADVTFSGSVLTVAFGKLQLDPSGTAYKPKISYISPTTPDGEVIAGDGFKTEIQIKAVC